jgi:hypothetical protein
MTTLKVKDLNPVQRETWDRMMALFDLGGSARRGACLTLGIPNRDFETHEFETALLAYAREAA